MNLQSESSCSMPALIFLYHTGSALGGVPWEVMSGDPFHSFILLQRKRSNLFSSALDLRLFHLLGAFGSPNSWTSPNWLPSHLISLSDWMFTVPFNIWQTQNCKWIREKGRDSLQTSSVALSIWLVGIQKKALGCWLSKSLSPRKEITGQRDHLYSRRNPRHQAWEKCHHVTRWAHSEKEYNRGGGRMAAKPVYSRIHLSLAWQESLRKKSTPPQLWALPLV